MKKVGVRDSWFENYLVNIYLFSCHMARFLSNLVNIHHTSIYRFLGIMRGLTPHSIYRTMRIPSPSAYWVHLRCLTKPSSHSLLMGWRTPAYPGGAKGVDAPCGFEAKTVKSACFGLIFLEFHYFAPRSLGLHPGSMESCIRQWRKLESKTHGLRTALLIYIYLIAILHF